MIELPETTHDFIDAEPRSAAHRESPLIDLAFQAMCRVDTQYSPLVLVGDPETGLCHWVELARECTQHSGFGVETNLLIFRGREFNQAVSHAVTTNSLGEFRDRLAAQQVIVFEYPTHLQANSSAYGELMELIDRSVTADQLIIVILDLPQLDQSAKSDPLQSRLSAGLLLQIHEPPQRLKTSLLRNRLKHWIAQAEPTLIDGILQQHVPLWSKWESYVDRILADLIAHGEWPTDPEALLIEDPESVDPKAIAQQVARYFQVKWSDVRGHSRRQSLVRARSITVYLIREITNESFEAIGALLGNRDHSTIIHAYRKIELTRSSDDDLELSLQKICRSLRVSLPPKLNA